MSEYRFTPAMSNVCPNAALEPIVRSLIEQAAAYLAANPTHDLDYKGIAGSRGIATGRTYRPITRSATLLSQIIKAGVPEADTRRLSVPPEEAIEIAHHYAVPEIIQIADMGWQTYVDRSEAARRHAEYMEKLAKRPGRPAVRRTA
jgi:hypothetical protein